MSRLVFRNYGGSFQLRIQNAQDLENIQELDDALWAATSITINNLSCDPAFASYVDTDQNGRIRTDEFREALSWLLRFLADRSRLSEGSEVLDLSHIDTSHPEGEKLRAAAEQILSNLNSSDAKEISLAQVRDVRSIMARADDNGDGIIPPEATSDSDLAKFITSVMETVGSSVDASGKPGISKEQLKTFFDEAEAYLAWKPKGEIPEGADNTEVMPWGTETHKAYELVAGLREKIDQFFTQCAMVRFDERTAAQMQLRQKELEEIDFMDKLMMEARLKDAPLASPDAKGILDLGKIINPIYADRLQELREKVLKRALGEPIQQLSEEQWERAEAIFAQYRAWLESKQGAKVEKLGQDLLRSYIDGPYKQKLSQLIAKDLAAAGDLNQLHNLEKLILYQRWLMELANNFVSFTNLYSPKHRSLFETGTLIIDGREITFTMRVQNRQAHKKIAERSFLYLLYLEITGRQEKDTKFEIVAAVTSGTAGRLRTGKRGVFFTVDGREWDAEVIDIVENPISIWESVTAPFKQLGDFVRGQVDKFTKSRQAKAEAAVTSPSASGMARDLLLGGGVAIAALGASFGYVTTALSKVKPVHILGTLVGLVAVILLPGIIIGFAKIRKRDMSILLEAAGWALNAQMRLSAILGRLFTHVPRLPKGARKERGDALVQFVKDFGYTSFGFKKVVRLILIILIILCLAVIVVSYLRMKALF